MRTRLLSVDDALPLVHNVMIESALRPYRVVTEIRRFLTDIEGRPPFAPLVEKRRRKAA